MAASLYRPAAICERNGADWAYVKKKTKKARNETEGFYCCKKVFDCKYSNTRLDGEDALGLFLLTESPLSICGNMNTIILNLYNMLTYRYLLTRHQS